MSISQCPLAALWIFKDARPKIVDAILTLIFKKWQQVLCAIFAIAPTNLFALEGCDNVALSLLNVSVKKLLKIC